MYNTDSIYNDKHLSLEQLISNVTALDALLDSGYKVSRGPSGWHEYDDRVFDGINAALTLLGHDVDYLEHRDSLSAESMSSANQEQLSTWFTLMTRGEHWTEGYVARAIEAGELQAITHRLVALLAG